MLILFKYFDFKIENQYSISQSSKELPILESDDLSLFILILLM
ncbi:hypothetical protein QMA87_01835 [Mycoplasma sp. M6447]|nr:hypothetical protein [Mycoplasma phocimorsus]